MSSWKLLSWNVNGIRAVAKKGFMEWFKSESPDILCLQETKAQEDQLDNSIKEIEGYGYRAAFLRKNQITDISLFDAQTYHKNPKTTEDYVFNFLFFPIS